MIRYALFDLDDTLYPPAVGLMRALGQRMTQYLIERLHIEAPKAEALRKFYNERYGSTTRGMVLHHGVDLQEFLRFAHELPVERYLARDPDLACLLDCIHAHKCVFTNAPRFYAERVLNVLGVADRFQEIFALEFSDFLGKPYFLAYKRISECLGVGDLPLMILDDSLSNLVPAKQRGWTTVWVNPSQQAIEEVDYVVNDLWKVALVFHQVGILDDAHRGEWERCLARCPLGVKRG